MRIAKSLVVSIVAVVALLLQVLPAGALSGAADEGTWGFNGRVSAILRSGGTVYGHFLLTASTRVIRPSRNQLRVAVMLADQVGAALADASRRDNNNA